MASVLTNIKSIEWSEFCVNFYPSEISTFQHSWELWSASANAPKMELDDDFLVLLNYKKSTLNFFIRFVREMVEKFKLAGEEEKEQIWLKVYDDIENDNTM